MTAEDDAFLADSLELMAHYANERDLDVWEGHHRDLHRRLVGGTGPRPLRLLAELSDHSERYQRLHGSQGPLAWAAGAAEHEAIVAACAERDAPLAAERLARHLTALSVLTRVAPEIEPARVRAALRCVVDGEPSDARRIRA